MKRWFLAALAGLALAASPALHTGAQAQEKVKVGISAGDAEVIWQEVKQIAAKDGLDVEVVVFSDYLLPNEALNAGDLDANAFQHRPFLENQIKAKGYKITPVGDTIIAPIGLYSKKLKALGELKDGATIGIQNDPSNGGRSLLLLQALGLIKLKDGVGLLPTVLDITENPKNLKIREIDAAQLARSLDDTDASTINTNYAVQAGLTPGKDSIAIESDKNNPYANFIAVRTADKDKPVFKKLVAAYQNDTIRQLIKDKFPGQLPAF